MFDPPLGHHTCSRERTATLFGLLHFCRRRTLMDQHRREYLKPDDEHAGDSSARESSPGDAPEWSDSHYEGADTGVEPRAAAPSSNEPKPVGAWLEPDASPAPAVSDEGGVETPSQRTQTSS